MFFRPGTSGCFIIVALAIALHIELSGAFSCTRTMPLRSATAAGTGTGTADTSTTTSALFLEGRGEYYGESGSSFMVKEFSTYEQLEEIVALTARALPERPDGIVCVVKYSSAMDEACVKTEAQYERIARENPSTCFLRCFSEYENADLLLGQTGVSVLPTFDVFCGGKRVSRVQGSSSYVELERLLQMYQLQNSKLDLFSESADNKRRLEWGNGQTKSPMETPRTTGRFVPGYDWDKDGGAFDEAASKAEDDFEATFGNWVPDISDE